MLLRKIVIFARYSTDMQNPKSCADQARDVREGLARKGIDASNALVIHEDGESGTRSDRRGFAAIAEMVARKEPFLLAVDDQSRSSRADNVFSFIKDLVYGGRPVHLYGGRNRHRRGRLGTARESHGVA